MAPATMPAVLGAGQHKGKRVGQFGKYYLGHDDLNITKGLRPTKTAKYRAGLFSQAKWCFVYGFGCS